MKKWLIFILAYLNILTVSCGRSDSSSPNPISPPLVDKPEPKSPEPEIKEPQDRVIYDYVPEWSKPLTVKIPFVNRSELLYVDDYLRYQREWVIGWGKTRQGSHIPKDYLSMWDRDNVKYVDKTEGEVKGIEKLEIIRKKMLERCPILSLPEHNSPVEIHWDQVEDKSAGRYKPVGVFVSEFINADATKELQFSGGLFPWISNTLWIFGKNAVWDYPKQTTRESDNPYGIDWTFVHEWGHHLMFSIDINLGRSHYATYELSESFAEALQWVCNETFVDLIPGRLEKDYKYFFIDSFEIRKKAWAAKSEPLEGTQYSLRSMESCLVHEKYHDKFDPNNFASALIEAYKKVKGRKLEIVPYPINFRDDRYAQASWVSSSPTIDRKLINNQPLQATRAEFLQRFLEIYDCGLANELIKADIEGKLKFEW